MSVNLELSTLDKHFYSENLIGERIKLSYSDAVNVFNDCIEENEELRESYFIFRDCKNCSLNNLLGNQVLIHTALDKFTEKLYFTLKKVDSSIAHIIFDNKTKEYQTFQNGIYFQDRSHPIELGQRYQSKTVNSTDCNDRKIIFSYPNKEILEKIWEKSSLQEKITNPNIEQLQNGNFENTNIIYLSDENYSPLTKNFHSVDHITLHEKEINHFDRNGFYSEFNPAHTTLLPKDIESLLNRKKFAKR